MQNISRFLAGSLVLSGLFAGCSWLSDESAESDLEFVGVPPVEPADVGETFETADGFRMVLIASEPLVYDPVAMIYDESGRAYVAEMSDYPYAEKETAQSWEEQTNQEPIGRIRILEDEDGDGFFDRSVIFAEELSWPTGLAVWKGGIFVTATPDIWYLKDTDGDLKADIREKVYTGFRKFNVQAVINNLIWGVDHWIYGAGGTNGGTIRRVGVDSPEVELSRNDFRFHPISSDFQAISGGTRFGNTADDWGNRFICNIRNPVQHVVLPARYLARNPHLPVAAVIHDAAEAGDQLPVYRISPPEAWRVARASRWAQDPTQQNVPRSELSGAGYWTSSSGVTIYLGTAYPDGYYGNVFIGEVAGNLIHRQIMTPDGVTFRSVRADENKEFVASRDNYFRAVNFVNAPDGTLHVVDMYREIIEHPWSIPDDIHAQLDLLSGTDRGRIYRLEPPGFTPPAAQPRLGDAGIEELVAQLENRNSWWRETAHRLLFERQDQSAVPLLRRLLNESNEPLARMHALWSLQGLDALQEADILRGLNDSEEGVRIHAVRLAEPQLNRSARLRERVLEMARDDSLPVRFQVAFTLGEVQADSRREGALMEIARRDIDNRWVRMAVLSSVPESSHDLLARLAGDPGFSTGTQGLQWLRDLATIVGARGDSNEIGSMLRMVSRSAPAPVQDIVVVGLGEGFGRGEDGLRQSLAKSGYGKWLDQVLMRARQTVLDRDRSSTERMLAVQLLAFEEPGLPVRETLGQILTPSEERSLQVAAIQTLGRLDDPEVPQLLVRSWRSFSPALRSEVGELLTSRQDRVAVLLDAVEEGIIPPLQISPATRARLLKHSDDQIRARAEEAFLKETSDREAVVDRYREALSLSADADHGEKVFETHCASCHRLGGQGEEVGPNLSGVRHKTREEILVQILDPNREVSPEFLMYEIELRDFQSASGVIANESSSSIVLRREGGVEETILRQDIEKITSFGLSIMPEGLESDIDLQQMADLLAFILDPGDEQAANEESTAE